MLSQSDWFNRFQELFSSSNLQLLLLIGSGILAVSLMILAVTRWGHSRPVWKCVILSVAAHILLIGYACGTHLISENPTASAVTAPLHVNIVDEPGESDRGDDPSDPEETPWDEFATQPTLPDVEDLERAEFDSDPSPSATIASTAEHPPELGPSLPLAAPPTPFKIHQLSEMPRLRDEDRMIEAPLLEPEKIEMARRGEGTSDQAIQPEIDLPEAMARPDIANDLATDRQDGPTFTRPEFDSDEAFVSDLIQRNSEFAVAAQPASRPVAVPELENIERLRPIFRPISQPTIASVPRRIGDGQPLPKIYALRSAGNRLKTAQRRGGSIETERAVELALAWLASNQESNGRWDSSQSGAGQEQKVFGHNRNGAGAQADCGITALATLSFLAAGHSHLEGKYKREVLKGLEYLVRKQKPDGDLAGDARLFARTYCHSMSLLALSEAFAMTGDQRLLAAVQRGVDFSIRSQNQTDGGWRYKPGDQGDMSQFGWQVLALHSAKLGGAHVPQATIDRMNRFLESCSSGIGGGLASYRPGHGPSTAMTAEALMCRYFLNQNIAHSTLGEATRRISSDLPGTSRVNLYYWYYGTLAMYHSGGAEWQRWNQHLKQALLPLQERHGSLAGSWAPDGVWGGYGGRVYSTALATLNLEVYYRYLPVFQQLGGDNVLREARR